MDYIVRMIAKDAPIVAMAIQGHDLVNRAQEIHHTFPVATAALGRTLLITSMMGEQLKEKDGSVTIRVQGGGPLGTILAVSDSEGNVRGYVQNGQVDLPLKGPAKLDVGRAVGTDGSLTLGVLVDKDLSVAAAGGYLIQLLPGATDEMIDKIEAGIAKVGPVTEHLRQGVTPEELLQMVLSEFDLELLKTVPVEYRCYCSRDRMRRALISLGKEELEALIHEQGRAEMTCQFCDAVHVFEKDELEALAASL